MNEQKIWLIEFPTFRYKEDVKLLARKNNLKIIDLKYKATISSEFLTDKAPKLTLKPEYTKQEETKTI